ncbi:MAG: type II toxin-antitoxin system HicB family antitoxin [Magnetococcales bacterium]|nr:type II toxin-antitoxin system HicB family antitoxin [Magnetococcales bacterium]
MTPMMHKGYAARIEYSDEDGCFVGRVVGIKPIITFHGESVTEIKQAFRESVDFYLETCAAKGESPDRPFSGKIMARVPPELHARAISVAESLSKSLNQFVTEAIEQAVKS